jgi:hypothetical protein
MESLKNRFRLALAEMGIEMTPEQAGEVYKMASELRNVAKRLSTKDLWNLEEDESLDMSREERKQIADLYRAAKQL